MKIDFSEFMWKTKEGLRLFKNNFRLKHLKQRFKYGFDQSSTYDLDDSIYRFAYPRLQLFLEVSKDIVDLSFDTFDWKGGKITLEEAIVIVLEEMKYITEEDYREGSVEVMTLFGNILPYLWW